MKQQILTAIEERYHSEEIQAYIEKKADEALRSIIDSAFRSYGDINKVLEKQILESLNINKGINLPQYNDIIIKIVERQFSARLDAVSRNENPDHKRAVEAVLEKNDE